MYCIPQSKATGNLIFIERVLDVLQLVGIIALVASSLVVVVVVLDLFLGRMRKRTLDAVVRGRRRRSMEFVVVEQRDGTTGEQPDFRWQTVKIRLSATQPEAGNRVFSYRNLCGGLSPRARRSRRALILLFAIASRPISDPQSSLPPLMNRPQSTPKPPGAKQKTLRESLSRFG